MTTSPASSASPELVARVAAQPRRRCARASPRTGRDPASIRIVAVTKTFGVEAVRAASANGLRDVGENYVDELETKSAQSARLASHVALLRRAAVEQDRAHRGRAPQVRRTVSRAKELEQHRPRRPAPGALCPGRLHRGRDA